MSADPEPPKQPGKPSSVADSSIWIFEEKYDVAEMLSEEMVLRWDDA